MRPKPTKGKKGGSFFKQVLKFKQKAQKSPKPDREPEGDFKAPYPDMTNQIVAHKGPKTPLETPAKQLDESPKRKQSKYS